MTIQYRPVGFEAHVGENRLFVEGCRPEMETGKPAILFVGGAFDGSWICRQQLDYWASRGWPAYAVNPRGYYKSRYYDVASLGYEDYLDDILAVRDHLGLRQVIYAGYSMGGILAQKAAELFGAHALILYDSDPPRQVARMAGAKAGGEWEIRPVMNFRPSREVVEEMAGGPVSDREFQQTLGDFKQSSLSGRAYQELEVERIEVEAVRVDCPILLLGISADDGIQEAMARYYNASWLVFEGYSHGSILFGRLHKPITRRVTGWMEAGFPEGVHETYRLEDLRGEEDEGRTTRLLYFTSWEEPEVHLCTRGGRLIAPVRMRRAGDGRGAGEHLFEADLRLEAAEKFYIACRGAEDRPYPGGFYEPSGKELYLADGEFFPHYPPGERQLPRYFTRHIRSEPLDHTFTINIMLPRDYGKGESGPYPVAVLNDGQNQWKGQGVGGGWHTDVIAVDRARRGRCRDIVLVSIFSHPQRDSTCLPPPHGHSNLYLDFVADTVLPELRKEINITSDPGETGMIGASYAANCAVYAGLERPDTFGLVGSLSFAHGPDDPLRARMRSLEKLPMKRLYIDCGTRWAEDQPDRDDFTGVTRELIEIAKSKGMVPEETLLGIVAEGHFHNEEYWRKRIGRCLEFLYPLR